MNAENLFNEMVQVVKSNPEKFYMNVLDYEGKRYAMFDYSLVMPFHFDSSAAFECRGSLFEIDENDAFVRLAALPYEKFFNLHEYDYTGCEPLYEAVKSRYGIDITSSEDLKKLPVSYVLNKEDGSIISTFLRDGVLDAKSNSSLTSEYKYLALDVLNRDKDLYDKTDALTQDGYTVIFELVSHRPKYQIVLPYDSERLIVTGARSNHTGAYYTHAQLLSHFGEQYVVPLIDTWDWADITTKEDIEGYVVTYECGLKVKLKTQWYVDRHHVKSSLGSTPRHYWELFINGGLDDAFVLIQHNDAQVEHFNYMVGQCEAMYRKIIKDGLDFYNTNKHLDRRSYFPKAHQGQYEYFVSGMVATKLYEMGGDVSAILPELHRKLLIRKTMSNLGIMDLE